MPVLRIGSLATWRAGGPADPDEPFYPNLVHAGKVVLVLKDERRADGLRARELPAAIRTLIDNTTASGRADERRQSPGLDSSLSGISMNTR